MDRDITISLIDQQKIIKYHGRKATIRFDRESAPTSLKDHQNLTQNDKFLWDEAYNKEYFGLHDTMQTWEYITENEYKVLQKTVGRALPSMAIATIKRDENGNPTRAKYRLVVLGNLNPNHWSKGDCYAPVMSQLEFCLLIAISCRLRCPIYTGDFTQAFCQSILPKYKTYIVRPPKDCLLTPLNIYLKLKRTLYGLKRSPRHWYKKASSTLKKL